MVVSLNVKAVLVIATAIILMIGLCCAQIYLKKSAKVMAKSQLGIIISLVLFYVGFIFINSYQYIMGIILGHIYDFTPVFLTSDITQTIFKADWFIMASVVVLGIIINLSFVAYSKMKYLFLAPFELLLMGFTIILFLKFSGLSVMTLVMVGGLILGVLMSVLPYLLTRLCGCTLGDRTTIGTFNYFGYYVAVLVGKLFGHCELTCTGYMSKTKLRCVKKPIRYTFIGMFIFSVFMVLIARAQGFETNMKLIILDRLAVEGNTLHFVNILGVLMGMGCFYLSYKVFLFWYKDIVCAIQSAYKEVVVCTDIMYQFQKCKPHIFIGFWMSLIGSLVSFWYMSFYEFDMVCVPNLIMIGVVGVLVAKMGDHANGIRGAILASFINGIVLTIIPTLSYLAFQTTALEFQFSFVDYYFIAQLLDIFFIF